MNQTGEILTIGGVTLPTATKPVPVIPWEKLKTRWPHLSDLPLKKCGGRVDVFLGLDHAHIMVLATHNGKVDPPFASHTKLG